MSDPIIPPIKIGWTTSEFWISFLTVCLSFVVGIMALVFHKNIDQSAWQSVIAGVGPIIAAAAAAGTYIWGRVKLKQTHLLVTGGVTSVTATPTVVNVTTTSPSVSASPTTSTSPVTQRRGGRRKSV